MPRDDWSVRRTPRRSWLVVVGLGAVCGLLAAWLVGGAPSSEHVPRPAAVRTPHDPLAVLHAWDQRRAAAWAAGDRAMLRDLYVRGSAAGRADVALLDRYLARDLVVVGMRRQVLGVRVLRRDTARLRLRVTDRLVGAWAVTADEPTRRVRLPESQPRVRVLDLRLVAGEWRLS